MPDALCWYLGDMHCFKQYFQNLVCHCVSDDAKYNILLCIYCRSLPLKLRAAIEYQYRRGVGQEGRHLPRLEPYLRDIDLRATFYIEDDRLGEYLCFMKSYIYVSPYVS